MSTCIAHGAKERVQCVVLFLHTPDTGFIPGTPYCSPSFSRKEPWLHSCELLLSTAKCANKTKHAFMQEAWVQFLYDIVLQALLGETPKHCVRSRSWGLPCVAINKQKTKAKTNTPQSNPFKNQIWLDPKIESRVGVGRSQRKTRAGVQCCEMRADFSVAVEEEMREGKKRGVWSRMRSDRD